AILKALGKMADLSVLPFLLENALDSEPHIQELMSAIGRIYHANMPEAFLKRHQAEMAEIVRRHFPLQLTEKVSALWKDSKVAERRGMLHIAGFLTDMTLIDYVLDELENPYLQRDALQAAAAFGTPAVPHLVRRLNAAVSVEQRLFLIQLLAATGSPEGVVPLLSQVRGDDDQVKMEGLAGLGRIEDDRSLQELTAVLKEPDPAFHEVAIHAVHTLLKQRPEFRDRVRKQGEAMLTSPEDRTRRNGYALLAESIAYGADGNLLKGLKDPSPDVRRFVVGLAGARIGPDAKDQLLPMLSDDNPKVRRAVITTLGRYLLGSGPDILLTTLQDEDLWVRSEAAFYLAQSTDPATADALLTLLEEDELPVRISALKGLAEVGCGALFGRVLELARNDPNMEIRRVCLGALARSGRSEGQALLMKALEDRHWEIRSAAIELMGDSADRRFLPVLLKELERDPDVLVKQSVIQALSRLGAVEAVPRLLQYLTDKDLKEAAYQFFLGLGRRYVPLIEHEAQSVDFQTKLILIEIMKSLELA
ncbi:MAG: HEAT repeat domain-containing protein, partial [Acidobacteriota bacterium]